MRARCGGPVINIEEKCMAGAKAETTHGSRDPAKKGTRRRVSIAPTRSGGTRDRVQSRDRLKRHPSAGQ